MLSVTGQRPKSRKSKVINPIFPLVAVQELQDPSATVNRSSLSGKQKGSVVIGEEGGALSLYMSGGAATTNAWSKVGGAGGGGAGITNLRVSNDKSSLAFVDEAGRDKVIKFCDLKATPCEYYLDVVNKTPSNTTKMKVTQGVESVVPIGGVSLSGRNHYITIDRATNRIIVPDGGLRGTFRSAISYRFDPSVKAAMAMDILWYYRKLGSSDAWTLAAKGSTSRTATQTTAAFNISLTTPYLDLPDYPIEAELRVKFTEVGTLDWSNMPLFNSSDDLIKVSLYKEPNYTYTS